MSFRSKLLLACLPLALAPLALFGLRARAEVGARLGAQYEERVAALAEVIEADLEREATAIAAQLERVAEAAAADNRLRHGLVDLDGADRAYVLDYAGVAMQLAGLDVLRIQDEDGRVLSSGHFRNEYDALDPDLPDALARTHGRAALVVVPTAAGPMLALARARTLRLGARPLSLVGGTAVDGRFIDRLGHGTGLDVRLERPDEGRDGGGGPAEASAARTGDGGSGRAREVAVPFAGPGADTIARFVVRASSAPLDALRREMDLWLLATLAAAAALALLLAIAVSARLGRPLADLAHKAGRVDLDRLDVAFATRRGDEIGALSRVLDRMTARLRASATRLREAERRATVGDIARQVNHDVRNGLIPIRHVLRHLTELARQRPDELPAVFEERQATLESSVEYLHDLAASYARLAPSLEPRPCDLNAIARAVVAEGTAGGLDEARVVAELAPRLPQVHADPVALRRILENLVLNAVESLGDGGGRVVVSTRLDRDGSDPRILLGVADTGRGMTAEERARVFDDFYTTKPAGTGLGLSIVRRLVNDLGGRITVESEPGSGTRFDLELPPAAGPAPADARSPAHSGAQRRESS